VAKDLSECDEIVAGRGKKPMCERVTKSVGRERYSRYRRVTGANRPNSVGSQRPAFADEHGLHLHRRTALQVLRKQSTSFDRQGYNSVLVSFAMAANDLPRPWRDCDVGNMKTDDIAYAEAAIQHQTDDASGPTVLSQLDFP